MQNCMSETANQIRAWSERPISTQLNSTGSETVPNFSIELNPLKLAALSCVELSWVGRYDAWLQRFTAVLTFLF